MLFLVSHITLSLQLSLTTLQLNIPNHLVKSLPSRKLHPDNRPLLYQHILFLLPQDLALLPLRRLLPLLSLKHLLCNLFLDHRPQNILELRHLLHAKPVRPQLHRLTHDAQRREPVHGALHVQLHPLAQLDSRRAVSLREYGYDDVLVQYHHHGRDSVDAHEGRVPRRDRECECAGQRDGI
ncbi:hypothetical protein BR93DRAFT_724835 [Coniochaeta sp. PMI_546]|nr:hypothetical protein BR93DRAFT_724835 [Coniochaeta sp. PMI_546]